MTHRAAAMMIKRHFQDLSQDGTSDIPRNCPNVKNGFLFPCLLFLQSDIFQHQNERPANAVPD